MWRDPRKGEGTTSKIITVPCILLSLFGVVESDRETSIKMISIIVLHTSRLVPTGVHHKRNWIGPVLQFIRGYPHVVVRAFTVRHTYGVYGNYAQPTTHDRSLSSCLPRKSALPSSHFQMFLLLDHPCHEELPVAKFARGYSLANALHEFLAPYVVMEPPHDVPVHHALTAQVQPLACRTG